jgi:hypothetical protein
MSAISASGREFPAADLLSAKAVETMARVHVPTAGPVDKGTPQVESRIRRFGRHASCSAPATTRRRLRYGRMRRS